MKSSEKEMVDNFRYSIIELRGLGDVRDEFELFHRVGIPPEASVEVVHEDVVQGTSYF